jgi:LacI family transcriptional regulator
MEVSSAGLKCQVPMNDRVSTAVGIKEIAKALGISIGTVDRALHSRSGVSPKTCANVLKMAEKLNYKPNVAARNLKLNRHLKIAVHLPIQIESFFDPLRAGVREAATAALGTTIDLDFRSYPRLGHGDAELLEADVSGQYDGIILTPGYATTIASILRRYVESGTAVVCVASDAPHSHRLTSVCADASVSGGIAAELLSRCIQKEGTIAAMMGDLKLFDHAEKLRGFAATLATFAPHLTLLPVIESHERPKDAYQATRDLLARKPLPLGIYIGTANSLPVLQALEEAHLLNKIQIVTTDLFPELAVKIESGEVLATLYQRPYTQGKLALEALLRFLIGGVRPASATRLAPDIVLRSNLGLFMRQHSESVESEGANRH